MYGKIWKHMYEGSLVYFGWESIVTFQQLIVLADKHGIVDMSPLNISNVTTIPLEIIEKGIEKLQEPDPRSRSDGYEGRRIALLDDHRNWGWQILNYEKYANARDMETMRAHWRQQYRVRKQTAKQAMQKKAKAKTKTKTKTKAAGDTF